ncbi:CK1/CK1/CK1-D protein kinase [Puccinia sorghi]|uniref:non-specific serine/threonine protein kinase n=1 Tax=Puccinia sorghi TaxID=27349 RepID=A0A0L6VPG7_9BASI|nr:CK1/CK1/CK1-D protein kinase [Puccinia sorghi]
MYRFVQRIGNGAFGEIYLGVDLKTNQEVAIKVEPVDTKEPQLRNEAKIYSILKGAVGFASMKWVGIGSRYTALVIDLLGCSLDRQLSARGRFSLKTVLMLADQMLMRLEQLHSAGFVHRDIKPGNFVMGRGQRSHMVHLIDFGLSCRFRCDDYQHIPYVEGQPLVGTACYSSICTHLGIQQTRRDDLEALGYMLISFLTGSLPWLGIRADTKLEKNHIMAERKIRTPLDTLCKGLPDEFLLFLTYTRALKYKDRPDYDHIRKMFRALFHRKGYRMDMMFDWS